MRPGLGPAGGLAYAPCHVGVEWGVARTRFLLLRHAQSAWNATGRWQGWGDPPLSAAGASEVAPAAAWLSDTWPELAGVVSSDLRRARQTADPVADRLGVGPVVIEAGVRERDIGAWTGLTREQIEATWPGQLLTFREGSLERPPRGESTPELLARAMASLERLRTRWSGKAVLVVCHGGIIRAVEQHLGAAPLPLANLCGRWVEHGDGGHGDGDGRAVQERRWRLGPKVLAPSALATEA